jgi:predicted AlkP superfamily pyrophosphatase or phosphodiesterase
MRKRQPIWLSASLAFVFSLSSGVLAQPIQAAPPADKGGISHVLLISVDGMHAIDLEKYIATNDHSTLAMLAHRGVRFTNASTSNPSDSFPGLLSIVTGGSSRSTGVYYDDSYDRSLVAPVVLGGAPTGVTCTPNGQNTVGTEVLYDETVDLDLTQINGGGGINPKALPRDPVTCNPVYPHSFLKVNTLFEVLKANGLRTAWTDKHLSYELVNGPSGTGVDDLFTPEIAATISVNGHSGTPESSEVIVQAYDEIKVQATIHQIDGLDHTGTNQVGVPAIFGMNFQSVSVGQKLEHDALTGQTGGYLDAQADPSPLLTSGLDYVDSSLGRMVAELKAKQLFDHTLIVVTAKHGQSPINPALTNKLGDPISPIVDGIQANLIAQETTDDIGLLWLSDSSKTSQAATALQSAGSTIGISSPSQVLSGATLVAKYGDPATNPVAKVREPDIIVTPNLGVIYTTSTAKIAEHGGFNHDDTNVAMLFSGPNLGSSNNGPSNGRVIKAPVQTTQIAPTIVAQFGIDPSQLQAVQQEHTKVLPGLGSGN